MDNKVLLVVDVQTVLFGYDPYNIHKVIDNIKQLLAAARANNTEVIYVRHDGGKDSGAEVGSDGWQIYHEIAPLENERIFDKVHNSAFRRTGLKEYLDSKGVKTIILTGMQTEYCIDTTCKCAFEFEYKVIIPQETNSTFGNEYLTGEQLYQFYNYSIWDKTYADVVPMEEALAYLK